MYSSNTSKQIIIFFIFLSTLLLGFYLNEDLAGGANYDYNIHKETINSLFSDGLIYGLLNYDNFPNIENSHSPVFLIFLNYLIFHNEFLGRLIYAFISSFIVLVFYKNLSIKYKNNLLYLFLLSNFFFLSPYFRASSIWPGDETLALLFFCISIFFSLKFINSNHTSVYSLFFNVLFLAIASYLRPIYCIFSLYFFFIFFINSKFNVGIFLWYVVINLILAFPAIYYVFVLEIYFFSTALKKFNFVNSFTLVYLTIFFYLIPFLLYDFKKTFVKFNRINFLLTIIFTLLVTIFFSYNISYGGGFFLILSDYLFKNDILVYIFFPISFYFCNQILELNKLRNLVLFLLIIFVEIDDFFFMESYDPLFYVLFLTLFDTEINKNLMINLNKRIIFLFSFQIFLLISKFCQLYVLNNFKLIL